MTLLTAIILPALLLEDDDLFAASLLKDGRGDGGAGHDGSADLVTDHQNLVERDGLAGLARELFDADHVVGGNLILLAAGLDDCEHNSLPFIQTKPDAALQVWTGSPREGGNISRRDAESRLFRATAARGPFSRRKAFNPAGQYPRQNGVAPKILFGYGPAPDPVRRGDRVVDCDGLENRCTREGTVSSNLTLSARSEKRAPLWSPFF